MVKQKQRELEATGKQYTDTVRVPDQAVAKRGEQAQQSNGELSQQFFKAAINQHQHQVKAAQQVMQMPVATYMNFANSMFSFSNGSVKSTERAIKEAKRSVEEAQRQVKEADGSRSEAERRAEQAERS